MNRHWQSSKALAAWSLLVIVVLLICARTWWVPVTTPDSPLGPELGSRPVPEAVIESKPGESAEGAAVPRISAPPEGLTDRLAVTGYVVDCDSNLPLCGALVQVGLAGAQGGKSTPCAEARTDKSGLFLASDCPNMPLLLCVNMAGYATSYATVTTPVFQGESQIPPETSISVGVLRLQKGIILSGHVLNSQGAPLAGEAQLYIFEGGEEGSAETLKYCGVTDQSGAFSTSQPLSVKSENTHLLAISSTGTGFCRIAALDTSRQHQPDVVVKLQESAHLKVTVSDEAGQAVQGARVTVLPLFYPLATIAAYKSQLIDILPEASMLYNSLIGTTGGNGCLDIDNLPSTVGPTRAKYMCVVKLVGRDAVTSQEFEAKCVPLSTDVQVVLPRQSPRVQVLGRVVAIDGQGISGAVISGSGSIESVSNATGHFALVASIPASGVLTLEAKATGYASRKARLQVTKAGDVYSVQDCTFSLGGPFTLVGRVTDTHGAPLSGVTVTAHGRDKAHPMFRRASPPITGGAGRFAFTELPMGEAIDLRSEEIASPEGRRAPIVITAIGEGQHDVTIVLDTTRPPTGTIEAHVINADGTEVRRAVATAVMATSISTGHPHELDSSQIVRNGEWVKAYDVPLGEWRVWVLGPDDYCGYADCQIREAHQIVHITVNLAPPAKVAGRLVFRDGLTHSDDGIRVNIRDIGEYARPTRNAWREYTSSFSDHAQLDPNMFFSASNLIPGAYRIVAIGRSWSGEGAVTTDPHGDSFVELLMHKGSSLTVRGPGLLPHHTYVLCITEGEGLPVRSTLVADGAAVLVSSLDISPGSVRVAVFDQADLAARNTKAIMERTVTVEPGASAEVIVDRP